MVSKQKKNISPCDNPKPSNYVIDCYAEAQKCHWAEALFVKDYIEKKEASDERLAYDNDFRKKERKRYRALAKIA